MRIRPRSSSGRRASAGSDALLEAENLRLRYRNGALGVLDVSFRVSRGQVVGLFGANGAGKTTTVRAASGFLKTEGARIIRGSVRLNGRDITNFEPHRSAKLGMFFIAERTKIFPNMSVAENLLALGRPPRGQRKVELLDEVFTLFPVLKERRRQQAGTLSGGQRQMLAIGRGVVADPKIMIIDEMTLGLHHSLHPVLFDAVQKVAATGMSVLLVDESTGFALDVVDYCYVLAGGRVYDEGPSAKFRDNELLVAGYVDA